jgi:hypothetical protein
MCLLLTLLAVPVFYSLFDDAQESTVWQRAAAGYNRFKVNNLHPVYEKATAVFRRPKKDRKVKDEDVSVASES